MGVASKWRCTIPWATLACYREGATIRQCRAGPQGRKGDDECSNWVHIFFLLELVIRSEDLVAVSGYDVVKLLQHLLFFFVAHRQFSISVTEAVERTLQFFRVSGSIGVNDDSVLLWNLEPNPIAK